MKRILAASLFALTLATPAAAQPVQPGAQLPQVLPWNAIVLPAQTLIGNSLPVAGTPNAVPFSALTPPNPVFLGVTIDPIPGTTNQALNISQSGPISGSTATTINYNNILINGDNHNNASNLSNGLNLTYNFGGSTFQGAVNGLNVTSNLVSTGNASNPNPFYTSMVAQTIAFNSDTATSSLIGLNAFVQTQTGATGYLNLTGIQTQAGMITSGGTAGRNGLNTTAVGNFRGSTAIADAGIIIGSTSTSNNWLNGIVYSRFNGAAPIATTGCAICSDTNAETIATWADFHTYTITGNILNFANYQVTGAGNVTAKTLATSAPNTQTGATYSVAATDYSIIANNAGGTLTLTLPTPSTNSGRWLMVKTTQNQTVVSASSNVVPRAGGAAAAAILAATAGNWAGLQSDGTNWVIMAGTP